MYTPEYKPTTVSTQGELETWLDSEALPATPYVAAYLGHVLDLQQAMAQDPELTLDERGLTADHVGIVGATIARQTEQRIAAVVGDQFDGVKPLKVVTEADITSALDRFDPTSDQYRPSRYEEITLGVHAMLHDVATYETTGQTPWID